MNCVQQTVLQNTKNAAHISTAFLAAFDEQNKKAAWTAAFGD
jgi:hypothetical protein